MNRLKFSLGGQFINYQTVNVLDFIPLSEHKAIQDRSTTTDLTAYIEAATAAMSNQILHFPSGKYICGEVNFASGCIGAYSDDGAVIAPVAGSTDASNIWVVENDNWYMRGLFFDSPISTNPAAAPAAGLAVRVTTASSISNVWIDKCRFRGGCDGINFVGNTNTLLVTDCKFESQWRGGSTVSAPLYASYSGNKFINCGISDGTGVGASLAGALRIGSSTQPVTPELYSVVGNTFKDCCVNLSQESLDLSGNAAKNVVVANNNYSATAGNGFLEAKCADTGATSGDNVYRRFTITGNNIQLPATASIAFNLHTTNNTTTTSGKLGQVLISGNNVVCNAMPASSLGIAFAIINGWDDVSIIGNKGLNLGRGIELDGYGVDSDTISRINISGNDFYVYANCIFTSSTGGLTSVVDDLVVKNNALRAVELVASFGATANTTVTKLTFTGNDVISDTTSGLDIRDCDEALISFNSFNTIATCITCQGTTPGAISINFNHFVSGANALTLTTGTLIEVTNNRMSLLSTARGWSGAATVVAANNYRGTVSAIPTSAAAVGDVWLHNAPTPGGAKEYACITAGNSGAAVFDAVMMRSLTSGTVTQSTNKATGVTLNAITGDITMNNANLVADTGVTFNLTNSFIAAGDMVVITHSSVGALGAYNVQANTFAAGSCAIAVRNTATVDLAEAIVLRFVVIKAPV